jgi:ATP-dependent Clp protease ATP-binding subunit ClpC
MFERYTEKARRAIFFAHYEASQLSSSNIETEHLLLGLLHEDHTAVKRCLSPEISQESIWQEIEAHTIILGKTSGRTNLPFSNECKRALAYAAPESHRLGNKHIGTEHLLLGLLREEHSFAALMLKRRGVELERIRREIAASPPRIHLGCSGSEPFLVSAIAVDETEANQAL